MDSTSLSLIIILYSGQGYRKKLFLIPNMEERFKHIVKYICDDMDIIIIAMKCDKDHIHMFLNCLPILS
jgi:putative transposase